MAGLISSCGLWVSDCGIDAMKMAKNKDHKGGCGKEVEEEVKKALWKKQQKHKSIFSRAYLNGSWCLLCGKMKQYEVFNQNKQLNSGTVNHTVVNFPVIIGNVFKCKTLLHAVYHMFCSYEVV